MTLFVDVDDTLVLFKRKDGTVLPGPHPYGSGPDVASYAHNVALVQAILTWANQHRQERVVVWSGGGGEYAARWRDEIFTGVGPLVCLMKNTDLPAPGDICVDDMPLRTAGRVVTWQEFVAEVHGAG